MLSQLCLLWFLLLCRLLVLLLLLGYPLGCLLGEFGLLGFPQVLLPPVFHPRLVGSFPYFWVVSACFGV